MKLHGGIRVAGETIWAASNTYTIKKQQYVDGSGSPNAVVSGASPEVIVPFVTDYPDVTIKDKAGYENNVVNFQKNDGFLQKRVVACVPSDVYLLMKTLLLIKVREARNIKQVVFKKILTYI